MQARAQQGDLSYSRIRDNDRINVVGRVKSQDSVLESDRGVSSNADATGDDSHARTLLPATRTYTLNGVVAHPISDTLSASFNAKATYLTSQALNGLPSADLDVPADSPYAMSDSDTTVDRFLSGRSTSPGCRHCDGACGRHVERGPPKEVALVDDW